MLMQQNVPGVCVVLSAVAFWQIFAGLGENFIYCLMWLKHDGGIGQVNHKIVQQKCNTGKFKYFSLLLSLGIMVPQTSSGAVMCRDSGVDFSTV